MAAIGAATTFAQSGPNVSSRIFVSVGSQYPNPQPRPINETAVAFSTVDNRLVAAWNLQTSSIQSDSIGYAYSSDGGLTWTSAASGVGLVLPKPACCVSGPGDPPGAVVCPALDPFVAFYPAQGVNSSIFVAGGIVKCSLFRPKVCLSGAGGTTFSSASVLDLDTGSPCYSGDYADHTRIANGKLYNGPTSDPKYFYITSHSGGSATCPYALGLFRSTDAGSTWTAREIVKYNNQVVQGNFACPAVAPNGKLHIGFTSRNPTDGTLNKIGIISSTTNGVSFTAPVFPVARIGGSNLNDYAAGNFYLKQAISMAADPNDSNYVYLVYTDLRDSGTGDRDIDVYLIRTTDGGQTWSDQVFDRRRINQDNSTDVKSDQYIPAVTVDGEGRVHVVYYDVRHHLPALGASDFFIDTYYSYSTNRGVSWTDVRLEGSSTNGTIHYGQLTYEFLGEYNSIASRTAGGSTTVVPVFMGTPIPDCDDSSCNEMIVTRRITWTP